MTLCLFGGLIGMALGIGAAVVIGDLAGWPVFIGPDAIAVAIGFSGAVGVFFGWYPASKASRMEPVAARGWVE